MLGLSNVRDAMNHESMRSSQVKSRRNSSRQQANIIHKPLDEILVLVLRIPGHSQVSLSPDLSSGDLDFEFVFEVVLCRGLYRQHPFQFV